MLRIKKIKEIANKIGWTLSIGMRFYDFETFCKNGNCYCMSIKKVKNNNLNNLINEINETYNNYITDAYCEEIDRKLEELTKRLTSYRYIKSRKD